MRLTWRRSVRAEDRFETWLAQQHQKQVLESGVTAPGPCPDEAFLRDLARKASRISLSDPRVDHAASCPKCMNRLLALREEIHSRRQKLVLAFAAASCLVVAVALISMVRDKVRKPPFEANTAVVSETVNLWDAGTLRGQQPSPLQSVSLPATLVRVKIVLPRFSAPGQYEVAVTRDQAGTTFRHTTLLRRRVIVAAKRFLSISTLGRPRRDRISFLRRTNRTRRRTTTLSRSSRLPSKEAFRCGLMTLGPIRKRHDKEPVLARVR